MLQALFGNNNIKKILFFLLVNEKCYPTQLHRMLMTPLTPIQKACERLEKGGIITSYYEGKTRVYKMNQSYPLFKELEIFLRRAYVLLPPQEKKLYHYIPRDSTKSDQPLLLKVWKHLQQVNQVSFIAKSKNDPTLGWDGNGEGKVEASFDGNATILFKEEGNWQNHQGKLFDFSNTFRWTLDRVEGMISLEHLRHGPNHPVFLFHLIPVGPSVLESVHSHLCGEDTYFGHLQWIKETLKLSWRIIGPKKNEEIEYKYSKT